VGWVSHITYWNPGEAGVNVCKDKLKYLLLKAFNLNVKGKLQHVIMLIR
jgi:hypothetical protein